MPAHQSRWPDRVTIKQVLLLGLLFRLFAVFFSKGYAFHDDHFEMAELVQRWRDGYSFLWTGSDVHVFSLVYPGFLYLVFELCHAIGLSDPEQIMFVLRLIHALFSLLGIYYGFKLVQRIGGNQRAAIIVALFMAVFWLFPFLSVRHLREFFCIPFLLAGSYYLADTRFSFRSLFCAALLFALAFSIRLQTILIPLGAGIFLLFQKNTIRPAISFAILFGLCFMMTQGLFDLIYYGNPIASILEYFRFNADPANIAIQPAGPWYQYIGTVAGICLIAPFLLLVLGYVYSWKNKPSRMLLVGSLLFFIFHSYYSNKQERFILPFIPYFIVLGVMGYFIFYEKRSEKKWPRILTRFALIIGAMINTVALFVLTFTYSKRARVEAMLYLREKADIRNIIMEGETPSPRPPLFYLGKQINFYSLTSKDSVPTLTGYIPGGPAPAPNYIIMSGSDRMEERIERLKKMYPRLKYEKEISPGFVDNISHRLNPKHNHNESLVIYKID